MDAQNVQDVAQNAAEPMGTSDPVHLEAEPALLKRKSASLEEEDETKPGVASGRQIDGKEQDQSVSRPKNPPKLLELRRSPDYFFEDGNVYLLVYDTLFRVHRSRLSIDGSIFSTLFSLPQDGEASTVDGQTIERPIQFADKPRRFANLLWALYALPAQLRSINTTADNCMKLIDIATAAQKYCFASTEEWALSSLVDLVKMSNQLNERQINPWRIFALASLCNCDELRLAMVDKIKERASSGNLAYSWVIAIGESLGIPELLGEGYYRTVIKDPTQWNKDGKLNDEMMRKLNLGFIKLVTYKDRALSKPPPLANHACPMQSPEQCRARWVLVWNECRGSLDLPSVHVLGQLEGVSTKLRESHLWAGPCRPAWIEAIDKKAKEFQAGTNLYNFFKP